MRQIAPEGPVYQAGTLSGNPVAMVAGAETLRVLRELEPYGELERRMEQLAGGVGEILEEKGIPHRINRVGSMMTVFFTDRAVTDFESAKTSDTALFGRFFKNLLRNGVLIPPSQFEAWFVGVAHEERHIDTALEKIRDAVKEL